MSNVVLNSRQVVLCGLRALRALAWKGTKRIELLPHVDVILSLLQQHSANVQVII